MYAAFLTIKSAPFESSVWIAASVISVLILLVPSVAWLWMHAKIHLRKGRNRKAQKYQSPSESTGEDGP
jgi:hypothetical protein